MPHKGKPAGYHQPIAERIAEGTRPEGECIVGKWRPNTSGYLQIKVDGKMQLVHRIVWEMAHGPIPDGLQICHTCDNPPCCRLEHLWLCTQSENLLDMVSKGRGRTWRGPLTTPRKGLDTCRKGLHALTPENVYEWKGTRRCRTCLHDYQSKRPRRDRRRTSRV